MIPPEPKGIGGWLILLAIGLLAVPAKLARHAESMDKAFSSPELVPLVTRDTSTYDWKWEAFYLCAVPAVWVLFVASLILIPLFFLKLRFLPITFAVFAAVLVLVNTCQLLLASSMPDLTPEYRSAIILQGTVGSVIPILWAMYLFRSRRASNTFKNCLGFKPLLPFFYTFQRD